MSRPLYGERKQLHLCTRCGDQLAPDYQKTMCGACLEHHRQRVRSAMRRKRLRDRDQPETMSMDLWNNLRSYQSFLGERMRQIRSKEYERMDSLLKRKQHLERELAKVDDGIAELEEKSLLHPDDVALLADLKTRIDLIGALLQAGVPQGPRKSSPAPTAT